jgi:hypothetical protein
MPTYKVEAFTGTRYVLEVIADTEAEAIEQAQRFASDDCYDPDSVTKLEDEVETTAKILTDGRTG